MHKALHDRETLGRPSRSRVSASFSSLESLRRLRLERLLEGHDGCVNTVNFNPSGDLLLSGSDDLQIIVWDWASGRQRFSFEPGHTSNIFQARVMPNSSDRTIVSCAADGQVRVSHLGEGGAVIKRKLTQHLGRAHKLAILPDHPHSFFSCGEDGNVCFFDLREDAGKSQAGIKLTVSSVAAGSRGGYRPSALQGLDLNAISINPCRPWLFAVGGDDQYARIFDFRAIREKVTASAAARAAATMAHGNNKRPIFCVRAEPVALLCPEHLTTPAGAQHHITCVVFSKEGELLLTYHQEDLYVFEPWSQQQASTTNGKTARSGCFSRHTGDDDDDDDGDERPWKRPINKSDRSLHSNDSEEEPDEEGSKTKWPRETGSSGLGSYGKVTMQFRGHRNVQTVKGCNFFGAMDEYVVSGSDCGHIFIWSKVDGKLQQLMVGDPHVVNCLEPHPTQHLVLATSGIASDVKIFSPTAEESCAPEAHLLEEVILSNSAYMQNRNRTRRGITLTPQMLLQLQLLQQQRTVSELERQRREGDSAEGQEQAEHEGRQRRYAAEALLRDLMTEGIDDSDDEEDEDEEAQDNAEGERGDESLYSSEEEEEEGEKESSEMGVAPMGQMQHEVSGSEDGERAAGSELPSWAVASMSSGGDDEDSSGLESGSSSEAEYLESPAAAGEGQ